MYYFLSGYTAKVAGTERGITEPQAAFSACFGEAFLPLHPTAYAKLLGEKMEQHNVNAYLVNTGWAGGGYGVGKRMSIKATRACINAILDGSIQGAEFDQTRFFKLHIPKELSGVDSQLLNPRNAWPIKKLLTGLPINWRGCLSITSRSTSGKMTILILPKQVLNSREFRFRPDRIFYSSEAASKCWPLFLFKKVTLLDINVKEK